MDKLYTAKVTLEIEYSDSDLWSDIYRVIENALENGGILARDVTIDEKLHDDTAYAIIKERFGLKAAQRDRLDACKDLPKILDLLRDVYGAPDSDPRWYSVKLLMHKNKIFNGRDG